MGHRDFKTTLIYADYQPDDRREALRLLSSALRKGFGFDLIEGDRDLANNWFVGHPIRSFFDYEKIGIWQLGEEDLAAENQQVVGEIRVRDQDGDGIITPADRIVLGSNVPKFSLGINNRMSYRGLDLTFFLFARSGNMIISEAHGSYKIDARENGPRVDYWTPENPSASYPRLVAGTDHNNYQVSDFWVFDASYLRLRNVTLGYNFPQHMMDNLFVNRLRVYLSGQNIFTLHNMPPGLDPETPNNTAGAFYPITGVYTLGFDITF
jgi:hypothetical protein